MPENDAKKNIDLNFRFKEKNLSLQDYKAVRLAWLRGLTVFRETLKQLDSKDLISSNLNNKILTKFNLAAIEEQMEALRRLETSRVQSVPSVDRIPVDSLILVAPKSLTKDELKQKIVDLAAIQNQPDFDFDLLLTATHALLNHSDITGDEKSRYEIYYNELKEYKDYIHLERGYVTQAEPKAESFPRTQFQPQTQYSPPPQSQYQSPVQIQPLPVQNSLPSSSPLSSFNSEPASEDYPTDRSTSISQVRNEMFAQLKKMRSSFQTGQT